MNASVYCPGISGIALSGVSLLAESHQGRYVFASRLASSNLSPRCRTAICRPPTRVAFGQKDVEALCYGDRRIMDTKGVGLRKNEHVADIRYKYRKDAK